METVRRCIKQLAERVLRVQIKDETENIRIDELFTFKLHQNLDRRGQKLAVFACILGWIWAKPPQDAFLKKSRITKQRSLQWTEINSALQI